MQNAIRKVLSRLKFKSYLHYKFLVQITEILVNDRDEYVSTKGSIYDFLGIKTHEEPETIKTRLKTIYNNFDKNQYEILGFEEKPKSIELLNRIIELSKEEKLKDKVETTDEQ